MTCPRTPASSGAARPVGRPREFDEAEVLDRAMEAFGRTGYEATSIADLVAATGLQKGSLYKAFGDKHGLFAAALDRYLDAGRDRTTAALADDLPARDAIARWLDLAAGACGTSGGRRGCLAVNMAVELGPGDEAIRDRLERHFRELERTLAGVVRRGQADGSIDDSVDPAAAASFLVVFLSGLMAGGRGAQPQARQDRAIAEALRRLDAPSPAGGN